MVLEGIGLGSVLRAGEGESGIMNEFEVVGEVMLFAGRDRDCFEPFYGGR